MKQLMISEDEFGDNVVLSSMIDFIKENSDGLTFKEMNSLNKLQVDDECYVSTHCGYVTVTRIK